MSDLLLEIGLEEVPAGFMPHALQTLLDDAKKILAEERLTYKTINVVGTPRRLVLKVGQLSDAQEDLSEILRGPSEKVAYDSDGNPSKALQGFAKSQGVDLADITVADTDAGRYVFANKQQKGRATVEVLPRILPALILGMSFPKYMRWGAYDTKFVRPIRWIVALLDETVVPFDIEMLQSGRTSRGHRVLGAEAVEIASASDYEATMRAQYVITDPAEREAIIRTQFDALLASVDAHIEEDAALLEEVVHLVEYPTALMGNFGAGFLEMPAELVITPMKEHQRYFPVVSNSDGRLLAKFLTVRNGDARFLETVQEGNESVLTARLSDAEFFYKEDLKLDPYAQAEKLKNVVFQESLGSVFDKTERVGNACDALATLFGYDDTVRKQAKTAAALCKFDLVSNVVTEFPELQGIMGERYLRHQGSFDNDTAQAVREHYMPRFAGDDVPASKAGVLVCIADKMDTICGCFAAGIEPSGSQDPYGLRRQATGVLSVLFAHQLDVSLNDLIDISIEKLQQIAIFDKVILHEKVYRFFDQRMRTILRDLGLSVRFTEAILLAGYERPIETVERATQLNRYFEAHSEETVDLLESYKRAYNLAQKSDGRVVEEALLQDDAEKALYKAMTAARREKQTMQDRMAYAELIDVLNPLKAPLGTFFEAVMVMTDDVNIRDNRLALLNMYIELYRDVIEVNAL